MRYGDRTWSTTLVLLCVLLFASAQLGFAVPKLLDLPSRTGWSIAAIDDFNGDGYDDLLWQNNSDFAVDFLDGGEVLDPPPVLTFLGFSPPPNSTLVGTGDITDDGKAELIFQRTGNRHVEICLSDNAWAYCELIERPENDPDRKDRTYKWDVDAVGDFNDDGVTDLHWRNRPTEDGGDGSGSGHNLVFLLEYANGAITEPPEQEETTDIGGWRWKVSGVGDIDSDGCDDLIWQNQTLQTNKWIYVEKIFEVKDANGTHLEATMFNLWQPDNAGWKIEGAADFYGDGNADFLFRKDNETEIHELGLGLSPAREPTRLRAGRYGAQKFEDLAYDFVGIGDLDGDGNADTVWRDKTKDETWVWLTKRLRAVHLWPKTPYGDTHGNYSTQWVLGVERCIPQDYPYSSDLPFCTGDDEPNREAVREELRAIKRETGLRQVKFELGVGKTFSFPDPTDDELNHVVSFLLLLQEENMSATVNIANHCWIPEALFPDPTNAPYPTVPTPYLHVGNHNKGECYQRKWNVGCDATTCSVLPPHKPTDYPNACSLLKWEMPPCSPTQNDGRDYLQRSTDYYWKILSYLENNVPDIRKTVMFFNFNGSPVMPGPNEPAAFNTSIFGPAVEPPEDDPHAEIKAAVAEYYSTVYAIGREYSSIPIGMKANLGADECSDTIEYEKLENMREALGGIVDEIDFFDFTSNLTINVSDDTDNAPNILTALGFLTTENRADRLSTIALTDFNVASDCADIPNHSGQSEPEVANHMQCFFDEVEEQGLLGWWFETYRADNYGLLERDGDADDTNLWNDYATKAIRFNLNYLDNPGAPGDCQRTIPYTWP